MPLQPITTVLLVFSVDLHERCSLVMRDIAVIRRVYRLSRAIENIREAPVIFLP